MAEQDPGGEGMPGSGLGRGWFRLPSWLRSELLHEWIRSGGILIAAGWGVYTFVWKDILVPSWQPATISLEASLTPVADRPPGPDGVEMTLELKGSNTSSRRVWPLANVWWLTEIQRQAPSASGKARERAFLRESNQVLEGVGLRHAERGVESTPGRLLAIGRLWDDEFIDPGASRRRTILVRIPAGTTAAELRVIVPLLTRSPEGLFGGRRLAWSLSATAEPLPLLCPTGHRGHGPGSTTACRPVDEAIDREMLNFDPKKNTITLLQQIGLPVSQAGNR
ncbi:MAG: hypothetical protein ACK46L_10770 [Synechococcaceae cyanobacterium]